MSQIQFDSTSGDELEIIGDGKDTVQDEPSKSEMDKITQYYQITNVKPEYYVLDPPYYKASKKRIIFNGKELELHYENEFGAYVENLYKFDPKVLGGYQKKILCINI